ncbi:MAG: hypothetical protein M3R51_10420, partial [Candidatus Eremiobacteraeota bacterium]|nr:hypothetical protein [Candidatus Eremiobacteraeota bacterium]
NLENVISDCCGSTIGGGLTSPAGLNGNLLPLKIEVIACANVNPLFPTALSWIKAPVYQAVGRAAATTLMATQEYMEVGGVINPKTGQPFQPAEFPESASNAPVFTSNNDANLRIDFGGNINKPYNNSGNPQNSTPAGQFMGTIGNQLMDVYTGWWTSIAVPPYSGTVSSSSYTCK